jgi:hypothetical protein
MEVELKVLVRVERTKTGYKDIIKRKKVPFDAIESYEEGDGEYTEVRLVWGETVGVLMSYNKFDKFIEEIHEEEKNRRLIGGGD